MAQTWYEMFCMSASEASAGLLGHHRARQNLRAGLLQTNCAKAASQQWGFPQSAILRCNTNVWHYDRSLSLRRGKDTNRRTDPLVFPSLDVLIVVAREVLVATHGCIVELWVLLYRGPGGTCWILSVGWDLGKNTCPICPWDSIRGSRAS